MTLLKTLATASAVALMAGGASQAATVFSGNLDVDQSTTAPGDNDAATVAGIGGISALNIQFVDDGLGSPTLAMSITFTTGLDWSNVVENAGDQMTIMSPGNMTEATEEAPDVTRLHLHNAARGETGPVVFGIFDLVAPETVADEDNETTLSFDLAGRATITTEWDLEEGTGDATLQQFISMLSQATDGEDVALYFNLHTEDTPSGLIRGQVVAQNSAAIPVPAAAPLFAAGMAGFAFLRRRKNAPAV